MQWVKTVAVNEPNRTASAADTSDRLQPNKHMKKLLTLALLVLATATTQAQNVSGYFRSNGTYVMPHYRSSSGSFGGGSSSSGGYYYRNPYAAYPSVRVEGYTRSTGAVVMPHYRTPANDTLTDNLSYRGYGTVRVPRY